MANMEIWKDIDGYEGLYQVSNLGRVKSLPKNGRASVIRKFSFDKDGYYKLFLWKDGVPKCKKVHRLVAEHFIPNPENKPCTDHINTIKTDNRVENLRWCTTLENNRNPLSLKHLSQARTGTTASTDTRRKMSEQRKGCKNGMYGKSHKEDAKRKMSKPVIQMALDGSFVAEYYGATKASQETGIRRTTISSVLNGRGRTAGGYLWQYKR